MKVHNTFPGRVSQKSDNTILTLRFTSHPPTTASLKPLPSTPLLNAHTHTLTLMPQGNALCTSEGYRFAGRPEDMSDNGTSSDIIPCLQLLKLIWASISVSLWCFSWLYGVSQCYGAFRFLSSWVRHKLRVKSTEGPRKLFQCSLASPSISTSIPYIPGVCPTRFQWAEFLCSQEVQRHIPHSQCWQASIQPKCHSALSPHPPFTF